MQRHLPHILLALALLPALAGCQFLFGPDSTESAPQAVAIPLTLPDAGPLRSAVLHLHARGASGQTVYVHRVTAPWDELTVTWNNFGQAFDPAPLDSFPVQGAGWIALDLTAEIARWAAVDNEEPFHGLLLRYGQMATPRSIIDSREDAANPPRLELLVETVNGLEADTLALRADTFIWQGSSNANYGDRNPLYTGWAQPQTYIETQTLLTFDLPVLPVAPTTGSVGDRVWLDENADGIQDATELGFAGVQVELQDADGIMLALAVSDSVGGYRFADLEPGDYRLQARVPDGYAMSPAAQGGNGATDSDGDAAGVSAVFSVAAGDSLSDLDFGLHPETPSDNDWTPRSVRYWLRHAGLSHHHGNVTDPDLVTPLLPLWVGAPGGEHSVHVETVEAAVEILDQKRWDRCHGPNAITALRAQALACALNQAAGAAGPSDELQANVDGFLATHAPADWDGLSHSDRRTMRGWWIALVRYNSSAGWWWGH